MENVLRRVLQPVVPLRNGETTTAVLMFAYSFLAMTAYNVVKPVTRSKFIADLGADNLPWVQLAAGILIGLIMQVYARAIARVPRRWAIPVTQAGCVALLVVFWGLFTAGYDAASVGLYVLGLILGILLISQFWTLANDIYDARNAKRLFGFIGGGASLGGATGAAITATVVNRVGTTNLLLVSAAVMLACLALVVWIVRREGRSGAAAVPIEEGVGGAEAIRLLRGSRHLQLIAVIIACAAMGGAIVEQQLNMAAEARLAEIGTDGITRFLAQVTIYLSVIGFLIQISLTSRIHSLLGIGFALTILPVGLGSTAAIMLFNSGLWAPAVARILDTSLRYTVDKTTREILFLPLPATLKHRAKAFVDVTMDRFAKAFGALLVLVLIKPWGFGLTWQQLSYASLLLTGLWIVMALRAKREYLATFRRSIARHDIEAADIRSPQADLQTIELLVEELAHPDERRVLYAIDLLETLEKRHLITPLLLHHASAAVRARALAALQALAPDRAERWVPAIERLLADEDATVRSAAVRALSVIVGPRATSLMRHYLDEGDPRVVATAAAALAARGGADDMVAAEAALRGLLDDPRDDDASRLAVAEALGEFAQPRFHPLLLELMLDGHVEVARAAIRSVARQGQDAAIFVPGLISLLRNRRLKEDARRALVGFGEAAVAPLAHFLHHEDEDVWVRRHVPATLASLPDDRTVAALLRALGDRDGFLRYKAIAALERLHAAHPRLRIDREPIEAQAMTECVRFLEALTLHANLCEEVPGASDTLVARALLEKQRRARERVFRLLSLIYPQADMRSAWHAVERGDPRARAAASEYLDNVLTGTLRRRVVLMSEDMDPRERLARASVIFRVPRHDAEDTLAQLVHDDDQVIAAAAIHLVAACGTWALASDIEHALAHRDARDWYVFEAASWALASRRLTPEERRARWLEPLPTVELADRLRRLPLFTYISVDELFRFAGQARQVRYDRGRPLCEAGFEPDTLQFLVDGEVRFDNGARMTAPGPLAFEEMLEGAPARRTARAVDVAVTLTLTRDEFLTLLSDNIDVARGIFEMLLDVRAGHAWPRVVRGRLRAETARRGNGPLQAVERALVLESAPLLALASGSQLLRIGELAREVPLVEGGTVVRAGDEPAIFLICSGAVSVEMPGGGRVDAQRGDAVGVCETLAGIRAPGGVVVTAPGTALRLDGQELFDCLADHVDLLQGLFAFVLRSAAVGTDAVASSQDLGVGTPIAAH